MARQPYFPGWNVVIGSGVGIGFGSVPFFASGFALLAAAMAKDFSWTQSDVAQAASIYLLLQTVAYPLCGWPLDRWGSRKFASLSIVLFAGSLILLSQINGSLWQPGPTLFPMRAPSHSGSIETGALRWASRRARRRSALS